MKTEISKRIFSSITIITLGFFFIIKGYYLFNFFLIFCLVVSVYEWHMMCKKIIYLLIGYLFLIFSFYSAFSLRNNFGEDSLILFLFVLLICIFTDIGGYTFGKIFKGPKITKISPNKTYSGMLGGYICSFLVFFFLKYYNFVFVYSAEWKPKLFILIILVSTISQIGDLIISYFKRLSNIKDTGKIIPGHGGILDRIDGMIFAFPFTYIMFKFEILV